jgi:hypothetical protein
MSVFGKLLKKFKFKDKSDNEAEEEPILASEVVLPPDVNFITPRILVTPFPSDDQIRALSRYFNATYKNKYMVWNLSEYLYNPEPFDNQVIDV